MAFSRLHRPLSHIGHHPLRRPLGASSQCRTFIATRPRVRSQNREETFRPRLSTAPQGDRIKWFWIPASAGIAFLGVFQFYRVYSREQARKEQEDRDAEEWEEHETGRKPKKRKRVKPSGPWQVQVMSTLPLKALSRLWGRFNELQIPYYLRVPGFKLYSWIFGVNLSEIADPDLHNYPNLANFFYRTLKPGVRPLDPNPNAILSPADGKVISFGMIEHGEVEQVKGVTYSLDALLGSKSPSSSASGTSTPVSNMSTSSASPDSDSDIGHDGDEGVIRADEEFAEVNGITYTLPNLFSGSRTPKKVSKWKTLIPPPTDQSMKSESSSEAQVGADLALSESQRPWWAPRSAKTQTALYYCVVYLAPGDYHRFHSPVNWVVESRRHFAGELYSVSPYLQRRLPGLFTLNERVVLLGRWRWGFFSYTPVGATNVGSIIVNFDKELRTNSLLTDTEADRAAETSAEKGEPYSGFSEATYENASRILGGHALKRGEEMGGFQLGSTIVLVFEAPKSRRTRSFDQGYSDDGREGGWQWRIEKGMKVKVGQAIGEVLEEK